jgi:hypothetical protein
MLMMMRNTADKIERKPIAVSSQFISGVRAVTVLDPNQIQKEITIFHFISTTVIQVSNSISIGISCQD